MTFGIVDGFGAQRMTREDHGPEKGSLAARRRRSQQSEAVQQLFSQPEYQNRERKVDQQIPHMGRGRIEGEKPVREQGQEGGNQLENADPHRIDRLAAVTLTHELPAELVRRVALAVQDEGIVIHVKIRPERPSHGQQSYQKNPKKRSPQQEEQRGSRNGTVGNDAHSKKYHIFP